MTWFLDGPAKDVHLMLRRAPHFLRAVRSETGEWDALDQINDSPSANEQIFVYEMVGDPKWLHIYARTGGGFYRGGKYKLTNTQPPDSVLRNQSEWQAWAKAQFAEHDDDPDSDHPSDEPD